MSERDRYIDECKQIQQNALYTAQSHHERAEVYRKLAFWLQVIPAVVAAVTGTLVGSGFSSDNWLWLTVAASVIAAVASVMNPAREHEDHARAAKTFTGLRHDARFLHEARVHRLSGDDFARAVERLHEKYNDVVELAPTTERYFFERARKVIKEGIHEPDRRADGTLQ